MKEVSSEFVLSNNSKCEYEETMHLMMYDTSLLLLIVTKISLKLITIAFYAAYPS